MSNEDSKWHTWLTGLFRWTLNTLQQNLLILTGVWNCSFNCPEQRKSGSCSGQMKQRIRKIQSYPSSLGDSQTKCWNYSKWPFKSRCLVWQALYQWRCITECYRAEGNIDFIALFMFVSQANWQVTIMLLHLLSYLCCLLCLQSIVKTCPPKSCLQFHTAKDNYHHT